MAEIKNITVNIEIHGTIDADVIAEEVKYHLRKQIEGACCPKPEPLNVGDYAKTLADSKHGTTKKGELVKIERIDWQSATGHSIAVRNERGKDGLFRPEDLTRATSEEVAKAKRQAEYKAVAEKWAKIGRKPNEFKVGDAVQYKKAFTTVTQVDPEGVIAINQSNHISKSIEVSAEDLTLVFPAEARFEEDAE